MTRGTSVVRRSGLLLQVIKPSHLLSGRAWDEGFGEQLPKRGIVFSPSLADQRGHGFMGINLVAIIPLSPTFCVSAIEDQVRYALGVPDGVGDRYRTALRNTQQRECAQTVCVDNALQIANHGGKGQITGIPVGQAVAALIVSNERIAFRE